MFNTTKHLIGILKASQSQIAFLKMISRIWNQKMKTRLKTIRIYNPQMMIHAITMNINGFF